MLSLDASFGPPPSNGEGNRPRIQGYHGPGCGFTGVPPGSCSGCRPRPRHRPRQRAVPARGQGITNRSEAVAWVKHPCSDLGFSSPSPGYDAAWVDHHPAALPPQRAPAMFDGGLTDLPPQSGPVTADTPLGAMPRSTVPAGGTTGATRCPSQGLGLQVIAARAGREHRRERGRSRGRGLGRRTR